MRELRAGLVELVGVFGLVLFSSGVVCINQLTTPGTQAATAPLTLHQPGLLGVAFAQGLILAVLLAVTVPVSQGYLNPAITLTQWVFGRMDTLRAGMLIAAQVFGSVLAGVGLRLIFSAEILQAARYGAPHINPLAYPANPFVLQSTVFTGSALELLLTFFLALAIFGTLGSAGDALRHGLAPGMVQAAAVLVGLPLTGAALNPVRWFGPVLCDALSDPAGNPWTDFLVYMSGPILGALLAGLFCSRLIDAPAQPESAARGKKV
jgi:glycerol uptake facilitator-like aquaporin